MTWLKHWTDADELHRRFHGYSMALPRALPWPLTMGINDVDRSGDIHAASACVVGGARGWARGVLLGSKRSMITMAPPQAGQG
jgi:hypothetical protein